MRIPLHTIYIPDDLNIIKTSGGRPQTLVWAILVSLLPKDGMFTASEVIFNAVPNPNKRELVKFRNALDKIARDNGFSIGDDPGPDNKDPNNPSRCLMGKQGIQPCRWKRENWFRVINHQKYIQLIELKGQVEGLRKSGYENIYFDTQNMTILCVVRNESDTFQLWNVNEFEKNQQVPNRTKTSGRTLAKSLVLFITILVVLFGVQISKDDVASERSQSVSDYLMDMSPPEVYSYGQLPSEDDIKLYWRVDQEREIPPPPVPVFLGMF